jgi:hypothetical protein
MRRARILFTLFAAAAAAWVRPAAAAPPGVESVVPGVVARGSESAVVLTGGRLFKAAELIMYEPGLTCVQVEPAGETETRVIFRADAGAVPGPRPFRLRTPGGLSELKVVHVNRFPVVAEAAADAPAVQNVALNTTVAGVIDAGETDRVAVTVKARQWLSAEVQAVRLGGEMTDTMLTVRGPDGRVLAQVDDTPATRQDPFISLVAPADGTYTVEVREVAYGGGPANTYALHVGDFARPESVYPPGGRAGRAVRLVLRGAAGGVDVEDVTLPADAGPWWPYYPALGGTPAPTPTWLRVRPYAAVDEVETNEVSPLPADPGPGHDWPVAFHGVIGGPGDHDAMAVRARGGELIQVEAFAARVGSPLDTVVEVFGPSGDLLSRNDDDATCDSRLAFRAPEDGDYRITIGDKRGEGGPGFHYRVEVEAPQPALTLFLAAPVRKSQARQVIAVPRGGRVLAHLGVRRDGFDAAVRVRPGPLPAGVNTDLGEIAAGAYLTPVVFEARADARLGAALVGFDALASTGDGTVRGVFAQPVDLLPGTGDSSYETVTVDRLAVAVIEEAPYEVALQTPASALARDGELALKATVRRAEGFHEPLEVALPYLPPGVEMDGPVVVPAGESEAVLSLRARPDAEPALWRLAAEVRPAPSKRDRREMTFALMAQLDPAAAGAGGRRRRRGAEEGLPLVASRFVPLELAPPTVSGRFAPAVVAPGEMLTVTCVLDSSSPAPQGVATLEGLPPRATADPVAIGPGTTRVEFRVWIAATTPVGDHDTLVCRIDSEAEGQAVVTRLGRGGRLKVTPAGASARGPGGVPLSPLDALRARERAARPAPSTPR